jgi:hypothetical protein
MLEIAEWMAATVWKTTVADNDSNGGRQRWQTTTAADDDSLQDQAANYNGEGRERMVRDGGDSRVVIIAAAKMAAAEDSDGGGRRRRTTAADNDGMQDQVVVYDGLGWEFRIMVPISGTPFGSGILDPFPIPKIPVRKM